MGLLKTEEVENQRFEVFKKQKTNLKTQIRIKGQNLLSLLIHKRILYSKNVKIS